MNFRFYTIVIFSLLFNVSKAQNFVVSQLQMPKCFGVCDGKITFTTGAVTGPFTAVLTNTSGCPNSTVQSSNVNSITIDSICGCNGTYSFSIYNPSMSLVGTMVQNIINYATGPLSFQVSSITVASCSNCCDGNITFSTSGGNMAGTISYSVDGTYTNNVNPLYFTCVGNHTVCIEDASGCVKCTTLNMSYTGGPTGIRNFSADKEISIYPNPAIEKLSVRSGTRHFSSYQLTDISGRVIGEESLNAGPTEEFSIELAALNPGIYYLHLAEQNGQISRFKFVKSGF
jgi:hypothetical protein